MDDAKLLEIHDTLVEVAFEAGKKILAARPSTGKTGSKKNCTMFKFPFIKVESSDP
jgi:myo-inositol-1(or 4)-monophosphatase